MKLVEKEMFRHSNWQQFCQLLCLNIALLAEKLNFSAKRAEFVANHDEKVFFYTIRKVGISYHIKYILLYLLYYIGCICIICTCKSFEKNLLHMHFTRTMEHLQETLTYLSSSNNAKYSKIILYSASTMK